MKRPLVADDRLALLGAAAAFAVGSWLLYDAYEARGRRRPWATRFLSLAA